MGYKILSGRYESGTKDQKEEYQLPAVVPENMSFEEYFEQIWGTETLNNVMLYGYFQLNSVLLALDMEETLADILSEGGMDPELDIAGIQPTDSIGVESTADVLKEIIQHRDPIDEIRRKYDPLAQLVAPHITLVYPFDSEVSDEKLQKHLAEKLKGIPPFRLSLHGIEMHKDHFGNYLFLNIQDGTEEIRKIHDLLYADVLESFDCGYEYVPHMTVGKLKTERELQHAYEQIRKLEETFVSMVDTISVEVIGEHEESIIVMEQKLG